MGAEPTRTHTFAAFCRLADGGNGNRVYEGQQRRVARQLGRFAALLFDGRETAGRPLLLVGNGRRWRGGSFFRRSCRIGPGEASRGGVTVSRSLFPTRRNAS